MHRSQIGCILNTYWVSFKIKCILVILVHAITQLPKRTLRNTVYTRGTVQSYRFLYGDSSAAKAVQKCHPLPDSPGLINEEKHSVYVQLRETPEGLFHSSQQAKWRPFAWVIYSLSSHRCPVSWLRASKRIFAERLDKQNLPVSFSYISLLTKLCTYCESQQETWLAHTRVTDEEQFEQVVAEKQKSHCGSVIGHHRGFYASKTATQTEY